MAGYGRFRYALFVLTMFSAAALSGCFLTGYKPFEPMNDTVRLRHGSLAVISGDPSEDTMHLADLLTRQLQARSSFKVMGQDEIRRRAGNYPVAIKEADAASDRKPVWIDRSEKAKLDALQTKVGTDYVFVVWTPRLTKVTRWRVGIGFVTFYVTVNGNLVEYPKGEVVGFTEFVESEGRSCFLSGKAADEDISEMLKDSATQIADKLIEAAKMEEPQK